jgi:hypothetical protein
MSPSGTPIKNLPAEPHKTSGGLTEQDLKHHSQELGAFGRIFGSRENAPIYFAGLFMVLCLLGLVVVPFMPASTDLSKGDMFKTLSGLILATLTFLGGYLGGSNRRSG